MRTLSCCALISLACTQLGAFQQGTAGWRKAALARPGLHHVNVRGRFVDAGGNPISDVKVELDPGQIRQLAVPQTLSDSNGLFRFADISTYSTSTPGLRWYPPEQWFKGAMAIAGDSFEDVDVGEIRLDRETMLRVAVEIVGGGPLKDLDDSLSVVLEGIRGSPRIVAEKAGPLWVLRQVPFQKGRWDVSIRADGPSEYFTAPVRLEPGRRDQLMLLRLFRDTVKRRNEYRSEGRMEISEALIPEATVEREFRARGRTLAPDNSPIQGVVVSVADRILGRVAPAWTLSDAGGHFELPYFGTTCEEARLA